MKKKITAKILVVTEKGGEYKPIEEISDDEFDRYRKSIKSKVERVLSGG